MGQTRDVMWWGGRGVLLAVLLSAIACARVPGPEVNRPPVAQQPRGEAELLRERAQAYWTARLKEDMATAYTFEDPLRQSQHSLVQYVRAVGTGIKMTSATVREVKIDGDMADVQVDVEGRYMFPGWQRIPARRTIVDDWQQIEGTWVHVLDFRMFRDGKPRITPEGTVTYPSSGALAPVQTKQ